MKRLIPLLVLFLLMGGYVLVTFLGASTPGQHKTAITNLTPTIAANEDAGIVDSSITTETSSSTSHMILPTKETLSDLEAGTILDVSEHKEDIVNIAFYYETIEDNLKLRINGRSYKQDCTVPYDELRYVRVLYYGFDQMTHIGELIVNKQIAKDIADIFKELYLAQYPIEKMVLIDEYEADDEASMADNNTSSFNFRTMTGSTSLSKHALGLAIDINPLYNPYVKASGSKIIVSPNTGYEYNDRTLDNPYYIMKDDVCYNAFVNRGFTWGGSWKSIKDYQHFEKSIQ
ncbi:MAG: M15 family metallopeptidase [Anaerocolumna sp.]